MYYSDNNVVHGKMLKSAMILRKVRYQTIHFVHPEYKIKQAEFPKPPKPLLYMPTYYSGFIQVCPHLMIPNMIVWCLFVIIVCKRICISHGIFQQAEVLLLHNSCRAFLSMAFPTWITQIIKQHWLTKW